MFWVGFACGAAVMAFATFVGAFVNSTAPPKSPW